MSAEFEDWAVGRLMSLSKVKLHDHAFREIVHHLYQLDEYPMTAAVSRLCGAGGAVVTFLAEFRLKKKELPTLPTLQLTKERETADLQLSMLPDLKSVAKIKLHDRAFREIIGHLAGLEYLHLAVYLDGLCTDNSEADAFGSKFVAEKKRLRNAGRVSIKKEMAVIDLDDDEQPVAIKHEYESDATRQGTDLASETAPSVDKKPIAFKREPNVAQSVVISDIHHDTQPTASCKTPAAEKDLAATEKHPAASNGNTAATEKVIVATKGQTAESNQGRTVIDLARPRSTQKSKRALQRGKTHTQPSTENSHGIQKEATFIEEKATLIKRQPNATCEEPWAPSDSDDRSRPDVPMEMLPIPSKGPHGQTKQVSTLPQFSDTGRVVLLLGVAVSLDYIEKCKEDPCVDLHKFNEPLALDVGYSMSIEWTSVTHEEIKRIDFFAQHPEYAIYGPSLEEARAMDKAYNRVYAVVGYEHHPNHPQFFERMALRQQALASVK